MVLRTSCVATSFPNKLPERLSSRVRHYNIMAEHHLLASICGALGPVKVFSSNRFVTEQPVLPEYRS
jgi:hypothetical protein